MGFCDLLVSLIWSILWMDRILRHFETMECVPLEQHCLLAFAGGVSFQGFLNGGRFRPTLYVQVLRVWVVVHWVLHRRSDPPGRRVPLPKALLVDQPNK